MSSNFINSMRLNNLQRQINELERISGVVNPMVTDLDGNEHAITDVSDVSTGTLHINNGLIEWDGTSLKIESDTIITDQNINSYIDDESVFGKVTIGANPHQYSIAVNPANNNLSLYSNDVIQPSSLVGEISYVDIDDRLSTPIINFQGTDPDAFHELKPNNDMTKLEYLGDELITSTSLSTELENYVNYSAATQDLHMNNHGIYLQGNNIAEINELGFTNDKIMTTSSNDLTYDGKVIINESNLDSYVETIVGSYEKIYQQTAVTVFNPNPSQLVTTFFIDFTEVINNESIAVGLVMYITGKLICIGVANSNNPSTAFSAVQSAYDYTLIIKGLNNTWAVVSEAVDAHNPHTSSGGVEDLFQFDVTTAQTNNTILINFTHDDNLVYSLKNVYTINYAKY